MTETWSTRVLQAFGSSAEQYNASANLQQGISDLQVVDDAHFKRNHRGWNKHCPRCR